MPARKDRATCLRPVGLECPWVTGSGCARAKTAVLPVPTIRALAEIGRILHYRMHAH